MRRRSRLSRFGTSLAVFGALAALWPIAAARAEPAPRPVVEDDLGPLDDAPSGDGAQRAVVNDEFSFRTRPDLRPPAISITADTGAALPGSLFFSTNQQNPFVQNGVSILDEAGDLVWSRPVKGATVGDFKVVTYDGAPALTWFEGQSFLGPGRYRGEWVVVDDTYTEVARIDSIGFDSDLHEVLLTEVDGHQHAIFLIYNPVTVDLTAHGGKPDATVIELMIQEVDLDTATVVFEWHGLDHVPVTDTVVGLAGDVIDYMHGNSIEIDTDGDLIASARTTSAVYKIDRTTGDVIWTLGGAASDFTFVGDAGFALQHDARRRSDGTLSLFDNSGSPTESRGVVYDLDTGAMTATLVREFRTTPGHQGNTMGNAQELANGNTLVGWGSGRRLTEFTAAGVPVFDATIPSSASYRVRRFDWVGDPAGPPRLALSPSSPTGLSVHVSWNGATEVVAWRIEHLPHAGGVVDLGEAARDGFETTVPVAATIGCDDLVRVVALDASDTILGVSAPAGRPGCGPPTGAMVYGPGSAPDWISDGFALRSAPVSGRYQPIVGDFLGDGVHTSADEILWYAPGSASDHLWRLDEFRAQTSPPTATWGMSITGTYEPLVGDFAGGPCDDIFWYAPGSPRDYLWISPCTTPGAGERPQFTSIPLQVRGRYEPVVGRFAGTGRDAIHFYAPGPASDHLWTFATDGTVTSQPMGVTGRYEPVVVDTTGDGRDEIVWYAEGTAKDYLWSFAGPPGALIRGSTPLRINGSYEPVVAASGGALTGSATSGEEVLWYAAGADRDFAWAWPDSTLRSVVRPVGGAYTPVVGRFGGCDDSEGIWWARAGGGHVWSTTGGSISTRPDGISIDGVALTIDLQHTGCTP